MTIVVNIAIVGVVMLATYLYVSVLFRLTSYMFAHHCGSSV